MWTSGVRPPPLPGPGASGVGVAGSGWVEGGDEEQAASQVPRTSATRPTQRELISDIGRLSDMCLQLFLNLKIIIKLMLHVSTPPAGPVLPAPDRVDRLAPGRAGSPLPVAGLGDLLEQPDRRDEAQRCVVAVRQNDDVSRRGVRTAVDLGGELKATERERRARVRVGPRTAGVWTFQRRKISRADLP